MAQKTNLNINPYYDDFSSDKNFYKVLFKPGYPVQARELTTLQSIFQNQVESFGNHIFKEGSVVSPGNLTYDGNYNAVKLNPTQSGIDISVYIDSFIGKTVVGSESGTTATIEKVIRTSESSDVEYLTLYVKYLDSDSNFEFNPFEDGEFLSTNEDVTYGNSTINADTSFASLISSNATAVGSAVYIGNSVYFVRGSFVDVTPQTLILEYYENSPSYRVGFDVDELLINAKDDESLYDNAKGFTNYAAPGADRFKISLSLSKRSLDDLNDTNFIELVRVRNGKLQKLNEKTQYNLIRDWIAGRTYDESGNYVVRPFDISVHNSLNDRLGNNGVYFDNQITEDKNTPSDDLMCVKASPGLAYVRGYEVQKPGMTLIDVDKPRDVEKISNMQVPFEMGSILRVNNVRGAARDKYTINLYNRKGGDGGAKIGDARVYSCSLFGINSGDTQNNPTTQWDLRLYDIQTYTKLTLNSSVSATDIPNTAFIEGKNSGASGYATAAGDGSSVVMIRQTSGTFAKGEAILVNGIDFSRTVKEFIAYGTRSIKSVGQAANSGAGFDAGFDADTVLQKFRMRQIDQLSIPRGLVANTAFITTSFGTQFVGMTTDVIISYQRPGFSTDTYNRITNISSDNTTITLSPITTSGGGIGVTGVYDGGVMAGLTTDTIVTPFAMAPVIRGSGSLYAQLPDSNVSSVDLNDATFTVKEQLIDKSTSGSGVLTFDLSDVTGISSAVFSTFDSDRYSVHYVTGEQAHVTRDSFDLTNNEVKISGLENSKSNIAVDVTLSKYSVQSKIKQYSRSIEVDITGSKYLQSGSGINTSIVDGLDYSEYYGIRVQDKEICLNYPDVSKVISVYESLDAGEPTFDKVQFNASAAVHTNAVIGENVANVDGAVARVISSPSANNLEIVYLTEDKFTVGDTVTFKESNITTNIEILTLGNYKDITTRFTLDKGQRDEYYDYSRLVRKQNTPEPSRKLKVVLDHYTVPATDDGDAFTALSYDKERFLEDVPLIGGRQVRASDTLDFRPRVATFVPAAATGSPFDFSSRSLDGVPKLLMAPNEGSIIGYEYYLPRIDKIFLNSQGNFVVEKGISSKTPKAPIISDSLSMEVGTINLPPYLYHPQDATVTLIDNKRYTMRDIGYIEDRVENLERVTSLSLLEVSTQALQIQDVEGKNRFKSGFFVDDFKNYRLVNRALSSIEINPRSQELVPIRTRNSIKSYLAPAVSITDEDYDETSNYDLLDPNLQKTGDHITLKYDEVDWLEQPFATTLENVNPFNVVVYNGTVELRPAVDTWVRTVQLDDKHINVTNVQSRTITQDLTTSVNLNLGSIEIQGEDTESVQRIAGGGSDSSVTTSNTDWQTLSASDSSTSTSTNFDSLSFNSTNTKNQLVSSANETFMRSRNTEFTAANLKSFTRYYQFIDSQSGVDFVPKLIEIANSTTLDTYGTESGSFIVGETVIGNAQFNEGSQAIKFRVCQTNHKFGPFNNPSSIFNENPYNRQESIASGYSQNSKVLNVDTTSLSSEAQGLYSGYIYRGMKLVGQESGAIAYVKEIRLISDKYGDLIGTFFIRNPLATNPIPSVRLQTGTKTFKLTSSRTNDKGLPGSNSVSFANAQYSSKGTVNEWQNEVTNTENIIETTSITNITANASASLNVGETTTHTEVTEYYDPLAQSFIVGGQVEAPSDIDLSDDVNGAFLTAVDLYFGKVDPANAPLRVQVRTVELGTPTMVVLGKTVTLRPRTSDEFGNSTQLIQTSDDGSVATKVTFPEPIWLEPNNEYAIVLISANSNSYEVWTAITGEKTVGTQTIPDVESVRYSQQFALGGLFKSQNGSIWTPTQKEDLKFKLYKAKFTATTGTAFFYNPTLDSSNGYVPLLDNNPVRTLPKTATVGISSLEYPIGDSPLQVGRKLAGSNNNNGSASIIGIAASVFDCGTITEGGSNYVSDTNVDTYAITGKGSGLKLNITATSGVIGVATFSSEDQFWGHGYKVGDVVGIVTSSVGVAPGRGSGAQITIAGISTQIDTLYVSGIQGEVGSESSGKEFAVGLGVSYYNDSGTLVALASTTIRDAVADGGVYSGNYMKVDHFDHNMYSSTNKVELINVQSSTIPTTLSATLNSQEVTTISVSDSSNFGTFEGITVSASNPGYVKIGNEIIKYEGVSSGTLTISSSGRGTDSTIVQSHSVNSIISKYELNGVSLRRINRIHDVKEPITSDGYYIEIDRSDTNYGINRSADGTPANMPQLSFTIEESVGGSNVRASENISYTSILPTYDILAPGTTTSASATIRTISGTSIDGTEASFNDLGFESVALNVLNRLNTTRIVCSKVNENEYLKDLPRRKSFTTGITLNSNDENLSPRINTNVAFTQFVTNRIDKPILDYVADRRSNTINDDPHACVYVSNTISLKNPASSLKVLLTAYRDASSDFRVLYNLIKADSDDVEQSFKLFPGYDNTSYSDENGFIVLDESKNSGLPDSFVPASVGRNQFLEYEFTANDLDLFVAYTIKIVMSGTNQALPPRIKELRTIALR